MQEYNIQDILKSIAELREANAEESKRIAELRESQAQTDRFLSDKFAKTDDKFAKTDERFAKTEILVKNLSRNISGVNDSLGKESEEFFFSSLSKNPTLGDIHFDIVQQNALRRIGSEEMETDILLENGSSVGIIEVKNTVRMDHLADLEKDIQDFPKFYPLMKDYKIYGAIAGKTVPKHIETEALKKGFFVLKQQGNHITVTPPYAFA